MGSNYTPPPGRPQSVPPGLFETPKPPRPTRNEGEDALVFARRVRQWKYDTDPQWRLEHSQSSSAGRVDANDRYKRLAASECAKRNRTETRGRWYTTQVFQRRAKRDYEAARTYLYSHRVEHEVMSGGIAISLLEWKHVPNADKLQTEVMQTVLPVDALPVSEVVEPVLEVIEADPPPTKRRIGTVTIEISPDEVEELLRDALESPDVKFEWPRCTIIAKEPR